MRNLPKLVLQRVFLVSFLLFIQLVVLLLGISAFSNVYHWFSIAVRLLAVPTILYILSRRTNPAYKMAWIIPILVLPLFGVLLYLFFGGNRLSYRLRRRMQSMNAMMATIPAQPDAREALGAFQPEHLQLAGYLERVAHCPVYAQVATTYYPTGEDCFPAMLAEMEKAERFLFLEYFIIAEGKMWDAILEILRRKVTQGVDVRVIYDDFGTINYLPMNFTRKLRRYGIQCVKFNPYVPVLSSRLNNRDHRKLLIIDGKVGFTGGINLADEYINEIERFGRWKDAGIRLEGEAVTAMTAMFLSMWNQITGQTGWLGGYMDAAPAPEAAGFVQPFTDNPLDDEALGQNAYLHLISHARRTLYIMTPYLIIDDSMQEALCVAARGGVDVRIITPHIPDKRYIHMLTRAYYEELLRAGVRIFEYTPGFIHSKVFCADSEIAAVGTINMDFRSLYLHFENSTILYGADCIGSVMQDFAQTFPICQEITPEDCKTGLLRRVGRSVLRLFAPLM